MDNVMAMATIATGDAPIEDVRVAAEVLLAGMDETSVQQLCTALRAWTWKALEGRRRDDGLREWFDVMRRIEARIQHDFPAHYERVRTLRELVYESISVAEIAVPEEILKLAMARAIVRMLRDVPLQEATLEEIAAELKADPTTALRIISMTTNAVLTEKVTTGDRVFWRLTRTGQHHADRSDPVQVH